MVLCPPPFDAEVGAGGCSLSSSSYPFFIPYLRIFSFVTHFTTSLHHLCLCHAPVMLGEEASDGSVTPLSWHLLLQPAHPSPVIVLVRPSMPSLSGPHRL